MTDLREVHTEIEINKDSEKVWSILANFQGYAKWNPFIRGINGQLRVGSKIEIHIETPSGKKRRYGPTVTKVELNHELRWVGKSAIPCFLNGEHIFTIEKLSSERVRFVHREIFDGLLTSLFGKSLDDDVKQGFEEMNKALKMRAELDQV